MSLRRPSIVAPLLIAFAACGIRADSPALEGLDAFVDGVLAEWKVPGLAVAVVKEGEVVLMKGYGFRDREARLPVTAKTLFAIGSISKSFAATGLGMLVDQGKLTWDTPVRDVLPEFRLKDRVAAEGATPRDLLSHRTGMPRHDRLWYGSGLSRRELFERLRFLEPDREFRSGWQYNNLMYLAAGMLDERLSGKGWEESTRERIFRPLGMSASNFSVLDSQKSDDFARPYGKVGDEVRLVPFYNIDSLAPAGAINSNVEEMIRYVRFHLDGGKYGESQILSARTAERLRSPETVLAESLAGPLNNPTNFPELGRMSYGLGFFLTTYRGHEVAWHSGSIDGFSALMTLLPRDRAGVIVLTNLSGNRPAPICVTRRILDRLLELEPIDWIGRARELDRKAEQAARASKEREAAESSASSPSHAWAEYAGTFEHPAYGVAEVTASGGGLTLAWRGGTTPLLHRRYDIFETGTSDEDDNPIPKVRLTFAYGSDGAIDRLAMALEPAVADVVFARRVGSSQRKAPPFDLLILNGKVVDGTGNAWFLGDIAVKGDTIVRVAPAGQLRQAEARRKVDASGLVVAPGFIDIQGHSREELLEGDGRLVGKVTQGVTTEILGEGESNAPSKRFDGVHGFDAWLKTMKRHGGSVNFGSFVGSQTVRSFVKGMSRGEPTPAELDRMKKLVRDAMRDGAFGLASALIYPPDTFVSTADLIALSREMAPLGGVYITHMRSEADQLLEAIDEAIRIGREGGVPVEIYHLKAAGRRNWDKAQLAIAKIAEARAGGLDIGANMYPYTAAGTGLTACLPPSASADGKLLENLEDPRTRAAIREEILHPTVPFENLGELATPEGILVLGLEKSPMKKYAGKRLSEIAQLEGKPWVDTAIELILAERKRVDTIYFLMNEDNLKLQLRQPWIKFGTDASGHDPDKPHGLVHPRSYGTFARILGKYVRDEGVLTLEDAIRKMTSAVATRLSIRDRGLLREGLRADIVVFDPSTIADKATFEAPHQPSVGVRDVFVNGVAVVLEGKHSGALPGQIVRGPGYRAGPENGLPARSGGTVLEAVEFDLAPRR
jgi:N-acyl-D-amino-acid deacylase